jgi:outer membrane immunogenic protein
MTRFFLATAAIAALIAVPAGAADMRMPVKAPAPVVAAPACANFGGVYIGIHGGWTYYQHEHKDLDQFAGNTVLGGIGSVSNNDSGWHAGGQLGYNWQRNCVVFGVQIDGSWTNAEADAFYQSSPLAGASTASLSSEMRWFGTVRTRTGVVVSDLFLYATGGVAFASFDRNMVFRQGGAPFNSATFSTDNSRIGFVVGAGAEWALGGNWSINSELLYMGFKKDEKTFGCPVGLCGGNPAGTPFRFEFQDSAWVARLGLNYRFGGGAPIVARY